MKGWTVELEKDFSCKDPIFIEGLPGIGNVGKIVIDYIIEELEAKKVGSFFSYDLPNSVFVTENNMIELPTINLYHKNINGQDFLFLTGDAQPSNERASYELTNEILNITKQFNTKQIITLGGIGLNDIPEDPIVYVTGNNESFIKEFKDVGVNDEVYGVVGPIVGVSGLLLGLSQTPAVALLGETFGHPVYIGLNEARKILVVLNEKYKCSIDFEEIDEEIKAVNQEMNMMESKDKKKNKHLTKLLKYKDLNYIG